MSSALKAAICRAASAAAGREMQKAIDAGLVPDSMRDQVIAAHDAHVKAMTEIAASVPDPVDDD